MIGEISGILSFFNHSQKTYGTTARNDSEKKELDEVKKKDSDVRKYVQARLAAARPYVKSISIQYRQGPDGRIYMVSGEVHIDTSEVPGDPDATIAKAAAIRRAVHADPSVQDHQAAAIASRMEARARMEKAETSREERDGQNVLLKDVDNYSYEDTKPDDNHDPEKIDMQITGSPVSAYSQKKSETGKILNEFA